MAAILFAVMVAAATPALGSSARGLLGLTVPAPSPILGAPLWVSPNSPAAQAASRPWTMTAAELESVQFLARRPGANWMVPSSPDAARARAASLVDAATAQSAVAVLVVYAIPNRDCGGPSGGGLGSDTAYRDWITAVANGIGQRTAVVVLEPDALALTWCLSSAQYQARTALLRHAVDTFAATTRALVYLDAGNSRWHGAATMAGRLRDAGIARARGFSLNVANFNTTANEITYGRAVSARLGGDRPFVIDISRNGNGPHPSGAWCNPPGRAIGADPTTTTGDPYVDAFLWIKTPGASDGACKAGDPPAGTYWPAYADGLVRARYGSAIPTS